MGLNKETIKTKARDYRGGDSMALAAQSLSGDASEEEVRESVEDACNDLVNYAILLKGELIDRDE